MKKNILRMTAVVSIFFILGSSTVTAQAVNQNTCFGRIVSEMVSVHDEWRSRLFGSRRGTDGTIIALTGGETDQERQGIFETRNRLTSELIEPIIDSYRVYRCRTLAVCQIAAKSFEIDGGSLDLKLLGCAAQNVERYPECYFAGDASALQNNAKLQSEETGTLRNCQQLATETLASERAVLKLAVAYDSGYRSLLQLSGIVDWMLQGFPTETIRVISDMVNMLGKLHQIPCFIGQCDNPNTDDLTP